MDDAGAVSGVERGGDLDGDLQGLIDRKRALCESRLERLAVEQLHHQERLAVVIANVQNSVQMWGCASSARWRALRG